MLKNTIKIILEDTRYEPFKVWHIFSWVLLILSSAIFLSASTLIGNSLSSIIDLSVLGLYFSLVNSLFHFVLIIFFSIRYRKVNSQIKIQRRVLKNKILISTLYIAVFMILFSTARDSLFY